MLVAPEGMRLNRIAERIDTLAELASEPSDLGRVTWISE
jgi:hypothetical protein